MWEQNGDPCGPCTENRYGSVTPVCSVHTPTLVLTLQIYPIKRSAGQLVRNTVSGVRKIWNVTAGHHASQAGGKYPTYFP